MPAPSEAPPRTPLFQKWHPPLEELLLGTVSDRSLNVNFMFVDTEWNSDELK